MINCGISTLVGGCGIRTFYGYGDSYSHSLSYYKKNKSVYPSAGWLICSYVTTGSKKEICEKMYQEMLDSGYPIVFESPVRKNDNSGEDFFFVIYDTSEGKK